MTAGCTTKEPCPLCHPVKDKEGHVCRRLHHFVMVTVVGTGLALPLDVEPCGPGDCEYHPGARLVEGSVARLGPRFADYLVAHGEFATVPFLDAAGKLGLPLAELPTCSFYCPALLIERLYRLRHLHRGNHGLCSASHLADFLWLSLCGRPRLDTS